LCGNHDYTRTPSTLENIKHFLNVGGLYGKIKNVGVISKRTKRGAITMAMNYDKLWKLLIDKKMIRTDLHKQAHITTNAIAAMGKGEDVSTRVLNKICMTLDCEIEDIVTCVRDEKVTGTK
jgi:putative transcriptional regulator